MATIEEFKATLEELKDVPENFIEDSIGMIKEQQDALFAAYKEIEYSLIEKLYDIADAYMITSNDITPGQWTKLEDFPESDLTDQCVKEITCSLESLFGIPTKIEKTENFTTIYLECSEDIVNIIMCKSVDKVMADAIYEILESRGTIHEG